MFELILLCLAAAAINVPFGFYRAGVRRYSWQWFLAIHFPVPLVIVMRLLSGEGWRAVPLLIACAVIGQIAGSALRPARSTTSRQATAGQAASRAVAGADQAVESMRVDQVPLERDDNQG